MYNRNGTYIYFHISVSEVHVMNLQQLRYAVEVAKTGSITAAAKNLYMGQPNLSKNIRELEAGLASHCSSARPAVWRPPKTARIFWAMPAASSRRWKAWRRCSAPIPRPERSSPSVRRVPAMLRRRSAGTLVRRGAPRCRCSTARPALPPLSATSPPALAGGACGHAGQPPAGKRALR